MSSIAKIAIEIPDKPNLHFSFGVRQELLNEPAEYAKPSKILAISAIDGKLNALLDFLITYKVIDKYLRWTFEDGHLVVVGDCFDREGQSMEVLWLLYSLEEKARKMGGDVHLILGNREVRNLNREWTGLHPAYARSSHIPFTALYNGNNELRRWLRTKNIIEKIGNVLFVHGGVAHELIRLKLSIADINEEARPWYEYKDIPVRSPLLKLLYSSRYSPLIFCGYHDPLLPEAYIDKVLKYFKVKTVITGHTPMEQLGCLFHGKLFNIHTDHSAENSEALMIRGRRFYRIDRKGNRERINWVKE